jgi:hypothetical protein
MLCLWTTWLKYMFIYTLYVLWDSFFCYISWTLTLKLLYQLRYVTAFVEVNISSSSFTQEIGKDKMWFTGRVSSFSWRMCVKDAASPYEFLEFLLTFLLHILGISDCHRLWCFGNVLILKYLFCSLRVWECFFTMKDVSLMGIYAW